MYTSVILVDFFFFKQKTAYEMRISDWSSDVCSSDLARKRQVARREHLRQQQDARRLDRGHREEEHHHRAVHGEDLIIGILWKNLEHRRGELRAHQQREHPRHQEEEKGGAEIINADIVVIYDGQIFPAPGLARSEEH